MDERPILEGQILLDFYGNPWESGTAYFYDGAKTLEEAQVAHRAWRRLMRLKNSPVVKRGRRSQLDFRAPDDPELVEAQAQYDAILAVLQASR